VLAHGVLGVLMGCSWSLTESELSGIGDVKVQGSGGSW